MSIHYKLGALFAALAFSSASFAQTPDVKPERIRGDIVSFKGELLTVHRKSGDTVSIDVKPTSESRLSSPPGFPTPKSVRTWGRRRLRAVMEN